MDERREQPMGAGRFWLVLIGLAIGSIILAVVLLILIGRVWYRWGFFGGLLLLSAILLLSGYIYDRRERSRRDRMAL